MENITVPYESMFDLMQFQDSTFYCNEKQVTILASTETKIHDNTIMLTKADIIKLLINKAIIINNQITLTL